MSENFIPRSFKDIEEKTDHVVIFDNLLDNNISVILGEPASGKTFQLKQFKKENSEEVHFVELVNIESQKQIVLENKKYVLLDSIDEALPDYSNHKNLQAKLNEYILNCKNQNPSIKFVLTCRQLEWTQYFFNSLKDIDKTLKVYQIQDLTNEEISLLLAQRGIDADEFWQFISKNYLGFLLKNILVIFNIIDNYSHNKNKELSYIDIYIVLIEDHLSVRGEERDLISKESSTKLFNVSSSLATYMTLNRKPSVSLINPNKLSDELYKIDNQSITVDDLNIILITSLFKKEGDSLSFFHKSVQEFLMAHFINEKKLDTKTIKELFSHEMRFYEEFEEVIVYLTNLNEKLFDEFVEFDPFIFKRHPNLEQKQQEKLLLSILNKLKNEKSMAWGRWHDFEDTTLVRLDKLKNLSSLIQSNIKSSEIDKVVFAYLMAILEYNYSQELEDLIFKYLDEYSNNNSFCIEEYDEISDSKFDGDKKLKELIEYCFIDNFDFNSRLLEFLKIKCLLNSNKRKISTLDLETKLFESLYGIKYIKRYGDAKKADYVDTGYDFEKLLELLDAIPNRQLEYIVSYLKPEDTLKWLEHIKAKQDKNNYHIVCWCVYAVLLRNNSKDIIKQIFEFLNSNFCSVTNTDMDKTPFDFKRIADNFWEVYFGHDLGSSHNINSVFRLLHIELVDIQKAVSSYQIDKYIEHYAKLRLNRDIQNYLMENDVFEAYMNDIWKKQKVQQEKWDKETKDELDKSEEYQLGIQQKKNREKICADSLKALATKEDFYNVFTCERIWDDENVNKLQEHFTTEQHQKFLDLIESDFLKDETYKKIKNSINTSSYGVSPTALYIYLFQHCDDDKIITLVQSKENFQKIFFHTFRFDKIQDDFFVFLTTKYFDYFVENLIELIKLLLEQSQNKDLAYLNEFNQIIEKIGKFDQNNLSNAIRYLVTLDPSIFKSNKEKFKVEEMLKIISLDKQSFDFIDKLRKIDIDKAALYLQYLLKINAKRTLGSYFLEYQKEPRYIKFYKLKKFFGIKTKDEEDRYQYDKPNISQPKIKLFKDLVMALKNNNKTIDTLQDKYLLIIINDYHEFFYAYERPTGGYSPDRYDDMNDYINYVWNSLSSTSVHIKLLQTLAKSKNNNFSNTAKYHLEQAYNNQNKDRNNPNIYYKKIFDRGNMVSASGVTKLKNKWGELTMFEKIGVAGSLASMIGLALYFMPTSSSSNSINVNKNNQSPIIQENHGNVIYNIDNSNNQTINNNVQISSKIDNLINLSTENIQGENKEEQKNINTKIFILDEAKKINEKHISINEKNKECKNQADNTKNLLHYDFDLMHTICNEIF